MPIHIITDHEQLRHLRSAVSIASTNCVTAIAKLLTSETPINALARMKFHELGFRPTMDRRLNLIEQINQTFTYLVSYAAAAQLLKRHPDSAPICLNLGTSSGSDLESLSTSIAAEVFAEVSRSNNRKLVKDVAKVSASGLAYKYVFFYCPAEECRSFRLKQFPDVEIVPLSEAEVWGDL